MPTSKTFLDDAKRLRFLADNDATVALKISSVLCPAVCPLEKWSTPASEVAALQLQQHRLRKVLQRSCLQGAIPQLTAICDKDSEISNSNP